MVSRKSYKTGICAGNCARPALLPSKEGHTPVTTGVCFSLPIRCFTIDLPYFGACGYAFLNMADSTTLSPLNEKRIQTLESSLAEIHRLLILVQTKLVGGLESDNPGLVSELNALKKQVAECEASLAAIRLEYVQQETIAALRQEISTLRNIEVEALKKIVTDMQKAIAGNNKFRWMLTGGLIVVNAVLGLYVAFKH